MDKEKGLIIDTGTKEKKQDIPPIDHAGVGAGVASRREIQETEVPVAVEVAAMAPTVAPPGASRKDREDAVAAARERYLARKRKAESSLS